MCVRQILITNKMLVKQTFTISVLQFKFKHISLSFQGLPSQVPHVYPPLVPTILQCEHSDPKVELVFQRMWFHSLQDVLLRKELTPRYLHLLLWKNCQSCTHVLHEFTILQKNKMGRYSGSHKSSLFSKLLKGWSIRNIDRNSRLEFLLHWNFFSKMINSH